MNDVLYQEHTAFRSGIDPRLHFEATLADISARFVSVAAEQVDEEIIEALRLLCESLGVDRSSLWQSRPEDPKTLHMTHLCGSDGGTPIPQNPKVHDYFPWAAREVLAGRTLAIADMSEVPPEGSVDVATWLRHGTKSSLVLPLTIGGGRVIGILSFAALQQARDWPDQIVVRCRLIAGVFANALARKRSECELRESEERYRTITTNLPGVVFQFYARENGQWGLHYMDQRAEVVLGLTPEPLETFFDRFAACVGEADRGGFLASIRDAIRDRRGWHHEVQFTKPTGQVIHVKGLSELKLRGTELVFSGVILDITERKRADEELRRTVEELGRLKEQLQHENVCLRREVQALQGQMPIIGNSEGLRRVIAQAQQVAATDSNILILGETGTGKELLATYLHSIGKRSGKPFITTNIAAIPATLLESELFGREKGAYTGALTRQIGRFELADGGTLFLDEIGEMPMETQSKLLRILQNGEFERLGSSKTLRANVQVIAATNRKLPELVRAGTFRQDLFYRLNVFPITVPPLRERVEDIPPLVWAFVKEFSDRMGKPIDRIRKADLEALRGHEWPGNVRELRNVIERSMILAQGTELRLVLPEAEGDERVTDSRLLLDVERAHVLKVLHSCGGKIRGPGGAAQILGLKPTTLYSLMERLGIERGEKAGRATAQK